MELAGGYTDVIDSARRRKKTHAAAELQQSLLPPRIARMGGGEVAGSVLPTYEVGGDWFDYVENRDGAWLAIADATGRRTAAGVLGAIALAALRSARRSGQSVEAAAQAMHQVILRRWQPGVLRHRDHRPLACRLFRLQLDQLRAPAPPVAAR